MNPDELLADVRRHWEHWADHLAMENWRVFFRINEKLHKDNHLMRVNVDAAGYRRVGVEITTKAPAERYAELAKDVLHEMLHVPLDELDTVAYCAGVQPIYRMREEGVIDQLTEMLYRMHALTGCER